MRTNKNAINEQETINTACTHVFVSFYLISARLKKIFIDDKNSARKKKNGRFGLNYMEKFSEKNKKAIVQSIHSR